MILGIYGAGGLGREVLILAQEINAKIPRWKEIFFIDDIHPDRMLKGIKVRNFDKFFKINFTNNLEVVIAVGEPAVRASLAEKIHLRQGKLATLIHPDINIPDCTRIGEGAVLCMQAFVSCDVVIGENVYIQPNIYVGHDCQIDAHSVVSPGVSLGGGCLVGKQTFIGMNASIKENIIIGGAVIVGIGSVVINNIHDEMVVAGNPARIIRKNNEYKVFK